MDVETNYLTTEGGAYWDAEDDQHRIREAMAARQSELEAEGHKVLIVPTGGAHPLGFAAHALTFKEMIEQSEAAGDRLDWIFHTAGTGTALPGLIAAKLLIDHPVRFGSIAICAYDEGGWMSPSVIVSRVKMIMKRLGVDPPPDHRIHAEIDVDQRFIGEDYAVPTAESIAAIRELAQAEGVFVGPVYTGKGFAGMLDQVRTGRVEPGSNIAFLHTGDVGNLFEIPEVVGKVACA
jgi:L-cysteate sulfo-lyase